MAKYLVNSSGQIAQESTVATSAGAGDSGKIPALNGSGILDSTIVNSKTTSAGAGDSGKLVALDGSGKIDNSMMPVGVGADTASIQASEALSAGDFVNIYDSSGARVRKADASTSGKDAHGFVLSAVSSGANATVYFEGTNTQVSLATPGTVFLSASTPGGFTSTAPSSAGNVVQIIGVATSATTINFERQPSILLV